MVNNNITITDKVQEDYDKIAGSFAESRKQMRWSELDKMIDFVKQQSKVLDIGCGTGRLCDFLKHKDVDYQGVDLSENMIEQAKSICPDGSFTQAQMTSLPFKDKEFDYVFMVASLHHLDTEKARIQSLKEAYRVLKDGGFLFVTVKSFWSKKYRSLFFSSGKHRRSLPKEIKKSLGWRDLFWPWKWKVADKKSVNRYYHAFYKPELKSFLLMSGFYIDKIEYMSDGKKVNCLQAKNIVAVCKKVL